MLTSAGVAAGIDLCLHMVRADHGADAANAVARRIVVAGHRDGGQAQFVERPLPAEPGGGLAATRAWMEQRLAEPLTVEAMAAPRRLLPALLRPSLRGRDGDDAAAVADRPPGRRRRSGCSRRPTWAIDAVADRCGLGSAPALRAHFARIVGTTPTAYRRDFRTITARERSRTIGAR